MPLCFLIIIFCCKLPNKKVAKVAKDRSKAKNYTLLLSKFKEISFDTIGFFPIESDIEFNYAKFDGPQLTKEDVDIMPQIIPHFTDSSGLYACYKFLIDSSRIGLITRTTVKNYQLAINLLIYNKNTDTIIITTGLAQKLVDDGVEGLVIDTNSWLYKDEVNNIRAFTWVQESLHRNTNREKRKISVRANLFFMYNISTNNHDSLGTKLQKLPLKLAKLVKERRKHIN